MITNDSTMQEVVSKGTVGAAYKPFVNIPGYHKTVMSLSKTF